MPPPGQRGALLSWLARVPLPAPEFWHGFLFLRAHDAHGHLAYLFGADPRARLPQLLPGRPGAEVAAAVPGDGDGGGRRGVRSASAAAPLGARGGGAALAAVAALAFSAILTVNIGLRHMLIVVPLLAIFTARALVHVDRNASRRRAR